MIASIPYHLTDSLQAFLCQLSSNTGIADPGKFVGGLLLMHPLYIASEMPFVPELMRVYLRGSLAWIGTNMGFRQATLLANVRDLIPSLAKLL